MYRRPPWPPASTTASLRRVLAVALGISLAFVFAPPPGAAQQPTAIPDQIGCTQCRLTLERFLEIGSSRDSVLLTQNTRFLLSADGSRIFASPTATPGVIAVYNSRGTLTGTIGREGRGPGEFSRVWGATISGDRLYVIDYGGQRINVFGPTLAFERQIDLRESLADNDGILVLGDRVIVSSVFQTPSTPAPVAILNAGGDRLRVVSSEPDSVPVRARRRYLAESEGGRFWVAPFNRYELQLWDTAGKHLSTVARNADWFQPWTVPTSVTLLAPQPQLKSVREDAAGLLWVAALVPDARWAPVPPSLSPEELDANRLLDTRIEVLHPQNGSLLAVLTSDLVLGKVGGGVEPMYSGYRTDANGVVLWTLYRPRLQGGVQPFLARWEEYTREKR
jgi:hypothetical protein